MFSPLPTLSAVFAVLLLLDASRAGAQAYPSAWRCVVSPWKMAFPPDPHPDPYPFVPAPPDATVYATVPRCADTYTWVQVLPTRTAHTSNLVAHAFATAGPLACPTLQGVRPWIGAGWGDEEERITATYDDEGRPLTITLAINTGGGMMDRILVTYAYDGEGRMTSQTTAMELHGILVPARRQQYVYETEGRLSVLTEESWINGAWRPGFRSSLTYGSGLYPSGFLEEEWTGTAWVNSHRRSFTYDGSHTSLVLMDNWGGKAWLPSSRDTYTYEGDRLTSRTADHWDAGTWQPGSRITYAYDGDSRVKVRTYESWNAAWQALREDVFSYTVTGLLAQVIRSDVPGLGGPLEPEKRTRFSYTGSFLAEEHNDHWNGATWQAEFRNILTPDVDGRTTEVTSQVWDGVGWLNLQQILYSYSGSVAVAPGPDMAGFTLTAGPNPARGAVVVRYTLAAPASVRLALYDVLGREVTVVAEGPRAAGAHEATFEASRLAPGVYVLRLTSARGAATQRLTVTR